jgi:hypothetical protein
MVFRVLRKIFGPERKDVTGDWRLFSEEVNDRSRYWIDQIEKNEMYEACDTCGGS